MISAAGATSFTSAAGLAGAISLISAAGDETDSFTSSVGFAATGSFTIGCNFGISIVAGSIAFTSCFATLLEPPVILYFALLI